MWEFIIKSWSVSELYLTTLTEASAFNLANTRFGEKQQNFSFKMNFLFNWENRENILLCKWTKFQSTFSPVLFFLQINETKNCWYVSNLLTAWCKLNFTNLLNFLFCDCNGRKLMTYLKSKCWWCIIVIAKSQMFEIYLHKNAVWDWINVKNVFKIYFLLWNPHNCSITLSLSLSLCGISWML